MTNSVKTIALWLTFTALVWAAPVRAQSTTEWILQQRVDRLGIVTAYLSHDAVKIVNLDWGYQLVAKAPSWKVHCFRPKEKIDWIHDASSFDGVMLQDPTHVGTANSFRVIPLEHGVTQGLKYTNHASSRRSLSKLYTADEITLSASAMDFLCRFYNLPNTGHAPIYHTTYRRLNASQSSIDESAGWSGRFDFTDDKRSGKVVELETKSWKTQPFKPQDFEYPRGYAVVKLLNSVVYSKAQKETVNEVFNDIGFASELTGSQKKTKTSGSIK